MDPNRYHIDDVKIEKENIASRLAAARRQREEQHKYSQISVVIQSNWRGYITRCKLAASCGVLTKLSDLVKLKAQLGDKLKLLPIGHLVKLIQEMYFFHVGKGAEILHQWVISSIESENSATNLLQTPSGSTYLALFARLLTAQSRLSELLQLLQIIPPDMAEGIYFTLVVKFKLFEKISANYNDSAQALATMWFHTSIQCPIISTIFIQQILSRVKVNYEKINWNALLELKIAEWNDIWAQNLIAASDFIMQYYMNCLDSLLNTFAEYQVRMGKIGSENLRSLARPELISWFLENGPTYAVCEVYDSLLFNTNQIDLLKQVITYDHLSLLWNCMCSSSDVQNCVVSIFSAGYFLLLENSILDEIYSVFDIEKIRQISTCMIKFVHNAIAEDRYPKNAIRLVKRLYYTNFKINFLPQEMWNLPIETYNVALGAWVSKWGKENTSQKQKMTNIFRHVPEMVPYAEKQAVWQGILQKIEQSLKARSRNPWMHQEGSIGINRRDFFNSAMRALDEPNIWTVQNIFLETEFGATGGSILIEACEELFDPAYQYFCTTPSGAIYPNPNSFLDCGRDHLDVYKNLGKLIGIVLKKQQSIDVIFADFFLKRLFNVPCFVEELADISHELWQQFLHIKSFQGDIANLNLTFTTQSGQELIQGGRQLQVNENNRKKFLSEFSRYYLEKQIEEQSAALLEGISQVYEPSLLEVCTFCDFSAKVSGDSPRFTIEQLQNAASVQIGEMESPMDIEGEEQHTGVSDIEEASRATVTRFWTALKNLNPADMQKFLSRCAHSQESIELKFIQLRNCLKVVSKDTSNIYMMIQYEDEVS